MKVELHPGFTAEVDGDPGLVRDLWTAVRDELASLISELRDSYTNGAGSGDVWAGLVEPVVIPGGPRDLELQCRFVWQRDEDALLLTLIVEDGQVAGYTADG
jgi:hypothetical protein